MKQLQVEIPDKAADALAELVERGWFVSEAEVVRAALAEFVKRNQFELLEKFQRDDIQWALKNRSSTG